MATWTTVSKDGETWTQVGKHVDGASFGEGFFGYGLFGGGSSWTAVTKDTESWSTVEQD